MQLIFKRARMEGFIPFLDDWDRRGEANAALLQWHSEGKLKYRVHVIEGLENAPTALNMLFSGSNQGKLVIKI